MVPFSHLHIGGTEIRGVQILPDCIGDRARVSKEQAWMSQCGFCMENALFGEKMTFFQPEYLPFRREKPIFEIFGCNKD